MSDDQSSLGVLQCWAFASPANRAVTGPETRFGRMIRKHPYDLLRGPEQLVVGQPQYDDDTARVLVSIIKNREPFAFVWILSKQFAPSIEGCWMTDAVFLVGVGTPPEGQSDQQRRILEQESQIL